MHIVQSVTLGRVDAVNGWCVPSFSAALLIFFKKKIKFFRLQRPFVKFLFGGYRQTFVDVICSLVPFNAPSRKVAVGVHYKAKLGFAIFLGVCLFFAALPATSTLGFVALVTTIKPEKSSCLILPFVAESSRVGWCSPVEKAFFLFVAFCARMNFL